MFPHKLCMVVSDRAHCYMEVSEYFVASPASDDFDDINADSAEEERHGSAGTEAAC